MAPNHNFLRCSIVTTEPPQCDPFKEVVGTKCDVPFSGLPTVQAHGAYGLFFFHTGKGLTLYDASLWKHSVMEYLAVSPNKINLNNAA